MESKHFTSKVKLLSSPYLAAVYVNFAFIQIKSKIKKESRSRILTH